MVNARIRLKERIRKLLPRRADAHRILSGQMRGRQILTSWHDYPGAILGTTERPLLKWFRRNVQPGETWIDAGAHYGYTAIALSYLSGPSGRVFAFEPVLATADCITRTIELNRLSQVTVVPFGLDCGSTVRTRQLPTVRGMADSTIASNGRQEQIFFASFDYLWPSLSGGNLTVHGIKIDVQGMEIEVLRGMSEALCRNHPTVIVEFHSGVDRGAVTDMLDTWGYQPRGQPVEPDEDSACPRYLDNRSYVFQPRR